MSSHHPLIIDSNVWQGTDAFAHLGEVITLPHQEITAQSLQHAHALITRSSTRVNADLLAGSSVSFVGTATIGDDHIDKPYLKQQGVTFVSAAGSSTDAVVEYILASLFTLENMGKLSINNDELGIIGVGRIGSLLNQACAQLGLKTLLNDPPRGLETSLDDLLKSTDILTLHTPLEKDGNHPTYHLMGVDEFAKFQGKGIINAGRGACVDNQALLDWLNQDKEHFAVLDCWENEPNINLELLKHPQTIIATPHIAGHSLDGKAANTYFVYKDLCAFLQVSPTWDMNAALPDIEQGLEQGLSQSALALKMYPIQNDTLAMKEAASSDDFKAWFSSYRKNYPVRRSWAKVLAANNYPKDLFF
ncbi:MAG: 4-phosphoerythronate dehydrogenase [Ghiorsea sp.]|nr:4-phosphoerythronate dehydrogenase [Ghiorsea sp.]